ncbi:hypothetical protein M9H77_25950 [Catharanthus roseus]|uniref:Uncharacterized protein n=1 Tax=Catharanthus roseus TaxID=4058 RepID=A0ACC0A9M7_CATRO|nr:hypothetical protein M9H77_25950 [Catharanthus roseus]
MASSSPKFCFLLFLITLFLSSHQILARESQFFNKVTSNNNNVKPTEIEPTTKLQDPIFNKPKEQPQEQPKFIPDTENNGYGLFGHESGQLPPSTTNNNFPYNAQVRESFPNSKYLPKNYNTEAYVTEPEGYVPENNNYNTDAYVTEPQNNNNNNNNYSPFSIPNSKYLPKNYNTESYVTEPEGYTSNPENNNNYYNAENGYYNNRQQHQGYYSTSATGNNYGANFAQKGYTTTAGGSDGATENYNNYYKGGNNPNGNYQKQGMSDTRFLENGKYFYDLNLEKSNYNPYQNTRGYYGNSNENSYQFNNNNAMGGYHNSEEQFQNYQDEIEEDMP